MMEDVKRWEGRTIEGRFPLRQYLGGSERSAVFLTRREGDQNAAIKFIPLNTATADQQIARWKQAAELSHPNLIRLFEIGRCRIDDAEFLFAVMEYAEEDLSQILPQRALTPGEAQEMLGPVVDVLRYLYGKGWVHGHLKPSNILASGDKVKVSSDGVGKAGERSSDAAKPSVYDPPEKAKGMNSAAGDVWSLGMTLTEALTRQRPQLNDQGELRLPQGLSSPFLDIARNCLWRDPQQRWAVSEVAARLGRGASAPREETVAAPEKTSAAERQGKPKAAAPSEEKPRSGGRWGWALLVVAAIAGGIYLTQRPASDKPTSPAAVETPAAIPARQSAPPPPAAQPQASATAPEEKAPAAAKAPSAAGDEIVERVVPNIPRSARETVQGRVKVRVRVSVDSSGKVVGTRFDLRGPSEYFARQAKQAAERWQFAPAPDAQRQWVLRFEFGRNGTQVFPARITRGH